MAQKLSKKINTFPKPKKARLPKSLGLCVDRYYDMKQQRLEADRAAKLFKEEEMRIFNHIIDNIPKGDEGAVGKTHKAIRTESYAYSIANDTEFYDHVKKTNSFDLLNRSINQRAVRERMEDTKFMKKYGGKIPGTDRFKKISLSVTKK